MMHHDSISETWRFLSDTPMINKRGTDGTTVVCRVDGVFDWDDWE